MTSGPTPVARVLDAVLEGAVVPSFTRLGPAVRSRLFDWDDPPPGALDDAVAVVTGATSGIGEALASGLARAGATVHAVGRDAAKLESVARRIRDEVPGADVVEQHADLGRLDDVRALAERLDRATDRIAVLAHVAGALVHDLQRTDDDIELTFQVHVVAPHLLTSALLPRLTAGGGRVVTMSSGGMYTQPLDVDALVDPPQPFDGTRAYARAKRAQVVLNAEWARRHPEAGVAFHAMHPGWVDTPGLTSGLPGFARVLRPALRTPASGADTALWLAWTPDAPAPGGDFWLDRRRRHTVVLPWTRADGREVDRLWFTVEDLAGRTS
ncbi:SDR family NAD(P)-dependent oxidoreductase [Actinomarinicola tropica]|uniref:SDR family NAD(P)-dependent oxidoreductase n=1 Tax=Actinomarinicola tropica TaxID=2789776 RepID=A0A5Q2RNF2_9ACTN|nr:SDR family NAD(P)-dependent oxidoreductase [Actinomarinicola tropica]QGG95946.1 SDR family NAD(P)-dependent oxidoreductase [Actinomarinicola tropica]